MIKRPFALAGFSFVFALLALNFVSNSVIAVASAAGVSLLLVLIVRSIPSRSVYAVAMLCVLAACVCFQGAELFFYQPALENTGDNRRVEARIISEQTKSGGSYCCTLKTKKIDGVPVSQKLRFYSREQIDAEPYDTVSFTGKIYETGGESDEIRTYFKSKNVFLGATSPKNLKITPSEKHPAAYYIYKIRRSIALPVRELLPGECGAVASGMITSDKSAVSDRTVSDFSSCGLSHILAVSGLHMSIVVFALYKLLLKAFRRFDRVPAAICILVAVAYAGVSGWSASAVRSCIMVSVMLLGKIIQRQSDALNSLGFAALGIALVNPYAVLDLPFMLSFSATLGIVQFYQLLSTHIMALCSKIRLAFLRRGLKTLAGALCVTVLATAFCLPVHIFFLGFTSLVFAPANLLTFFAVPAVVIFGIAAAGLYAIPAIGVLAKAPAFICGLFTKYILAVVHWLGGLEYASVGVNIVPIRLWLAAVLIFVAVVLLFMRSPKRAFAVCSVVACVSLTLTGTVSAAVYGGSVTVSALDVGCSECFVVSHGVNAVLIGCGGDNYYNISDGLENLGVTNIKLLIIPLMAEEDMACVEEIAERKSIEKIVMPHKDILANSAESYEITDEFTFDFYGTTISYHYKNSQAYCRLESAAGSALFIFAADTDKGFVGKDFSADFLFARAQPPTWIDTGSYKAVIVSYGGTVSVSDGVVYSTADNSQLSLRMKGNEKYKIY